MTSTSFMARAIGRIFLKSLPAVAILCVPMSVQAQVAEERAGTSTEHYIEGQQVLDTVATFGRCYASMNRTSAISLVATRPGTIEEAKVYRQLFSKPYQSCLGDVTQMRVPHTMVRGAIAEGLYHKKIPVPAGLAVATAPSRDQVKNFSDAALCYANANRNSAQALVDGTKPGSKREFEAVQALAPGLLNCVPPSKTKRVELDATLIRFRLAEAMWRLGLTPGATAGKN